MYTINLEKENFKEKTVEILKNDHFTVETFKYASSIEGLKIANSKGYITVLPFYGQIIWDVVFDGKSLTMEHMFKEPKIGNEIVDTYGCFAFHSGLLANGCPTPEDQHQLHGEFPCATMDSSYLNFTEDEMTIYSEYEYVKGFGHHYKAKPSVTIRKDSTEIEIALEVTNLSNYQEMPLQYMCHMNYAYIENGVMSDNLPADAFRLRTSIPSHVKPHKEWLDYMEELTATKKVISVTNQPHMYDPEICFFAENLQNHTEKAHFEMQYEVDKSFFIDFNTAEFPFATRWLLNNADQKVAAFALPGTCLPEGYLAAEKAGSLIQLAPGEVRSFHVKTGIK